MKKAPNNTMWQNNINRLLTERKIKQKDISKLLEMSEASLSRKVNGSRRWTFEEIIKLSQYLGISIDEILGELAPLPQSIDIRKIECAKSKLYAPNTKATIDEILGEEE